jgi:hypothetical protein
MVRFSCGERAGLSLLEESLLLDMMGKKIYSFLREDWQKNRVLRQTSRDGHAPRQNGGKKCTGGEAGKQHDHRGESRQQMGGWEKGE